VQKKQIVEEKLKEVFTKEEGSDNRYSNSLKTGLDELIYFADLTSESSEFYKREKKSYSMLTLGTQQ
jgi:hypothetical protein